MKYKLPKIEELFEAGTHYGHQVRRWHPKMSTYIFTARDSMHIVDLDQTEKLLEDACNFFYETAKKGGQIVFVGTKRQARNIIESEAKRAGALYVNERWLGGTMTNFKMIRKNIDKLLNNIKKRETGEFNKYTKKERLLIDRDIEKLQRSVGGLTQLKGTPSALFIIDPRKEKTALGEAQRMGVKVAALIDTNSDPSGIDYVIPGNDDAIKSIALIMRAVSEAIIAGYKDFDKNEADKKRKIAEGEKAVEAPEEMQPLKVVGAEITEEVAEKEILKAVKQIEEPVVIKDVQEDITEADKSGKK